MATKHKRATMTARQLAEDYLAHQITRDVTSTSTRHHLNQLLALFGGWQARRVGAAQMQEFLTVQRGAASWPPQRTTASVCGVPSWPGPWRRAACPRRPWLAFAFIAPRHGASIRPREPRLRACTKWPRRISGV